MPRALEIAYVAHYDVHRSDGVTRKMQTQVDLWGAEAVVEVFALSPRPGQPTTPAVQARVFAYASGAGRLEATRALVTAVTRARPDVIYYRYNPPYPGVPALQRRFPTVVELNTDDIAEYALGSRGRAIFNRLTRGLVFRAAAGIVSASHELAALPHVAKYRKPSLVLGNGIDMVSHPEVAEAPQNARPRFVSVVGRPAAWQGLDKVVWLAKHLPDCDFDLVGLEAHQLGDGLPPNLRAHGFIDAEAVAEVLQRADVGLATLALHRKGMSEASPLKVREYLACGLPVAIGYRDTDFPGGADFILELPNTEDNVRSHAALLRDFAGRMQGYRVPRESVAPHIDARRKEEARLDFMRSLAGSLAP